MFNYFNPLSEFDTIRYEVVLKDRALNESNRISTPAFLRPQ